MAGGGRGGGASQPWCGDQSNVHLLWFIRMLFVQYQYISLGSTLCVRLRVHICCCKACLFAVVRGRPFILPPPTTHICCLSIALAQKGRWTLDVHAQTL